MGSSSIYCYSCLSSSVLLVSSGIYCGDYALIQGHTVVLVSEHISVIIIDAMGSISKCVLNEESESH